jgi:hypothetical protein
LTEILRGNELAPEIEVRTRVIASKGSKAGDPTEVHLQSAAGVDYLVAAGAPGRTVGVPAREERLAWDWDWDWLKGWKRFSISIEP